MIVHLPHRGREHRSDTPPDARRENETTMKLYLASAIGRGSTELGAIDAALFGAGVASLNLVRLSSVIPPGSDIIQVERCPFEQNGRWGDRLYAVYAEQRTTTPGDQVCAGVVWCQDRVTGQGLLVEHNGDRVQPVLDQFTASLADLQAIRGLDIGPIHKCVVGAMCVGTPTCALVICGYATESWHTTTTEDRHACKPTRP